MGTADIAIKELLSALCAIAVVVRERAVGIITAIAHSVLTQGVDAHRYVGCTFSVSRARPRALSDFTFSSRIAEEYLLVAV